MHFDTTMISYIGDDSWVDDAVSATINCLKSDTIPTSGFECDNCRYFSNRKLLEEINFY